MTLYPDLAAVRLDQDGERELVPLYWGLLPPWAKADNPKRPPMLNNARAETVAEAIAIATGPPPGSPSKWTDPSVR